MLEVGADDVGAGPAVDAHGMDPATVLATLVALGGRLPARTLVVGCQVADTGEGMGLTPPVAAAVGAAVRDRAGLVARACSRRRWAEMCLGIPGQVVEMVSGYGDQLALVEVEGARRKVNIGLLDEPPAPGPVGADPHGLRRRAHRCRRCGAGDVGGSS